MKNYIISEQIVKALLSYLATRPYQEVHQVMPVLQSLEEVPTENKE